MAPGPGKQGRTNSTSSRFLIRCLLLLLLLGLSVPVIIVFSRYAGSEPPNMEPSLKEMMISERASSVEDAKHQMETHRYLATNPWPILLLCLPLLAALLFLLCRAILGKKEVITIHSTAFGNKFWSPKKKRRSGGPGPSLEIRGPGTKGKMESSTLIHTYN